MVKALPSWVNLFDAVCGNSTGISNTLEIIKVANFKDHRAQQAEQATIQCSDKIAETNASSVFVETPCSRDGANVMSSGRVFQCHVPNAISVAVFVTANWKTRIFFAS